ncbi:flagellar basal body P-ring formation chaperone FlgA [Polycladidibacter hongkongensis]|uniref:flagellar basal body P-ring formation chaperone FlgA n=1 Tax=Polycladidibacter hongkongensis TaxID=1647556 RepID=UPI00082C14E4|nr:flagellar basal body P-ring formation chaperone FlgA [Pseudovibrio hongkongensis]
MRFSNPKLLLFAALLCLAPQAKAELRARVEVAASTVTIGDFYREAGELADTPIFRSPDYGTEGNVPAILIAEQARAAGFTGATTDGLQSVTVYRKAVAVTQELLHNTLQDALAARIPAGEKAKISFYGTLPNALYADALTPQPVHIRQLNFNADNGAFDVTFNIANEGSWQPLRLSGRVQLMREVATLARPLRRGDIITSADIKHTLMPKARLARREPIAADDLIGMAARRNLRAGTLPNSRDIGRPLMVERGQKLTLIYHIPGMQITTQGRALMNGGMGDMVEVSNLRSGKKLFATITGSGRAVVTNAGNTLASLQERPR